MRLFVVTTHERVEGRHMTKAEFVTWLAKHPPGTCMSEPDKIPALDEALLSTIDVSHVGQVIEWRCGWVFCAEDVPA